jgi:hypothetical protein
MTFRERVKRVFRSKSDNGNGKPKVEYYRRSECPPSKFKGPFDREHQKRLAAWSFDGAMVEKRRSFEMSLSPYATYSGSPDESVSPDDSALDTGGTHTNLIFELNLMFIFLNLDEL